MILGMTLGPHLLGREEEERKRKTKEGACSTGWGGWIKGSWERERRKILKLRN